MYCPPSTPNRKVHFREVEVPIVDPGPILPGTTWWFREGDPGLPGLLCPRKMRGSIRVVALQGEGDNVVLREI